MSRFVVVRKDLVNGVDKITIESEGLTIGRLPGNDVILNDRTVSRTHAGIREINGEFWIFNLSASNRTMLNGELVDKTPLIDDDVLQIGPYLMHVQQKNDELMLTVYKGLDRKPVASDVADPRGTVFISKSLVKRTNVTRKGTQRISGTGLLTSFLPPVDEQALSIFWEKRKREAGKISGRTPLRPQFKGKVGKAQYNWYPTADLRRLWRKSYFVWGAILVVLFSSVALIIYPSSFAPEEVSAIHASSDSPLRGVAKTANANSCSSCHSLTVSMQAKCETCHTTKIFDPSVSSAHMKADVACISCHTEHQGSAHRPGVVASALCITCHNDDYVYNGKVLGVPHSETAVGYPVVNGKWVWEGVPLTRWKKKGLPATPDKYALVEQFHLVHFRIAFSDTENAVSTKCTDCHETTDRAAPRFKEAPLESCFLCHKTNYQLAGVNFQGPNCYSCHQQHGAYKNLLASPRKEGKEEVSLQLVGYNNVSPAGRSFAVKGGAEQIRQNQLFADIRVLLFRFGGIPTFVWPLLIAVLAGSGLFFAIADSRRRRTQIGRMIVEPATPEEARPMTGSLDLAKIQAEGPQYPYPVVDPVLCIGCHACVEACPHDVLAMVNGVSSAVAPDQCMEDTSCQVECPTQPKACIVLNTTKKIPARKVPARDKTFMTNVEGMYLIGDVSGVPLIKNAVNEGAQVIDEISAALQQEGPNADAQYDVAIVGIGPAGLSATAIGAQRGLKYLALEQDKIVSIIQNYPAGKYVFFKPETMDVKGQIPVQGAGQIKETIIDSWMQVIKQNRLKIQEEEGCTNIRRENGLFILDTEKGKMKEPATYKVRKVVLAIGNRGTPMRLGVPGEDLKIQVELPPPVEGHCAQCGRARRQGEPSCSGCGTAFDAPRERDEFQAVELRLDRRKLRELIKESECPNCHAKREKGRTFCMNCGVNFEELERKQRTINDDKVKYKLSDPDDYVQKKCVVVGGGNSAIEAAVDLSGFKRVGEEFVFTRENDVTLLVRSDFKGDLKLGNKMNIYDCMDAGKVKVYFGVAIKEITEKEVVIEDVRTKQEKMRLENDYVFALIGGDKPTKFLEKVGIKIGK